MSPPYRVLRHRDFRLLWLSQLVSQTGSQMQTVALHWHVYLLTRSPLALGALGLTRVVPIILFSLWGGVAADRLDRRRVMFATQATMLAGAVALAVLTLTGHESLAVLYGANALLAAAAAFDNPARQALVPRLVPAPELAAALNLNLTMFHAATIGGPALAGLLIAGTGLPSAGLAALAARGASPDTAPLALIYALNALSFVGVLHALVLMRASGRVEAEGGTHEPPLAALRQGLRFVFRTPIMVWTTGLDFLATFFAGSLSLLPIFADQVLRVGPAGYGWLVAAPALGALAGSLYTSVRHLPARQGRLLLGSVASYGLATVAYGLSRSYWLTFLALALSGLADLVSTVIRQTLRQMLTPDGLRGRMTSVNMIFFMGGPQLGELEAGFVASLFASVALGATVSVVSGGVGTVLLAAGVAVAAPVVRGYVQPVAPPRD
ncbi:MAG TPA: MFS transporter [Vicinamibacteria bacterium]|nr:MFS transporter [Vicinamibacteria bacterium]